MDDKYYCDECKQHFESAFDLIDHHTPEDEDEFDPALVLPNGYHLMIGSLLRFIFHYADTPEQIRQIVQSTYVTLYAAENSLDTLEGMIQDVVVDSEMLRFDDTLQALLEGKLDDEESGE